MEGMKRRLAFSLASRRFGWVGLLAGWMALTSVGYLAGRWLVGRAAPGIPARMSPLLSLAQEEGEPRPTDRAPGPSAGPADVDVAVYPAVGRLVSRSGWVEIRLPGTDFWRVAEEGQGVFDQSWLRVTSPGQATVALTDQGTLKLLGGTMVEFQDDRVLLKQGTLEVRGSEESPEAAIETPFGTVRSQGARVSLKKEEEPVRVRGLAGHTTLTNQVGSLTIGPGVEAQLGWSLEVSGARTFEPQWEREGYVVRVSGETLECEDTLGLRYRMRPGLRLENEVWQKNTALLAQLRKLRPSQPIRWTFWENDEASWLEAVEPRQEAAPPPVGGWVYGTVVDGRGRPVPRADVQIHDDWGLVTRGDTDFEGKFRLDGLSSGTYRVEVRNGDGQQAERDRVRVADQAGTALYLQLTEPPAPRGPEGTEPEEAPF